MPARPYLSKSRLISAWQCPKRLHLEKHHPELGDVSEQTEALFATALGLLAAIPAVVGYNNYINARDRLEVRLTGFSEEFQAILSRQLEEGKR